MGGPGSGRRAYARTATVSEADTLDVNRLSDSGVFDRLGERATATWPGGRRTSERSISVWAVAPGYRPGDTDAVDGESESEDEGTDAADTGEGEDGPQARALVLSYTAGDESVTETVDLEHQPCNFGGTRPYFRCPGCGTRREDLHRPPGGVRFRCRECHGLGYRTARASGDEITLARLRFKRAHERIDGTRPHPDGTLAPDRPEGMHRETYRRLVADLRAAKDDWDRAYRRKLDRMRGWIRPESEA